MTSCWYRRGCNPSNMGSAVKGKNVIPKEQILSFKRRPLLRRNTKSNRIASLKIYLFTVSYFFDYKTVFPFQNNHKNLDLSYKIF